MVLTKIKLLASRDQISNFAGWGGNDVRQAATE